MKKPDGKLIRPVNHEKLLAIARKVVTPEPSLVVDNFEDLDNDQKSQIDIVQKAAVTVVVPRLEKFGNLPKNLHNPLKLILPEDLTPGSILTESEEEVEENDDDDVEDEIDRLKGFDDDTEEITTEETEEQLFTTSNTSRKFSREKLTGRIVEKSEEQLDEELKLALKNGRFGARSYLHNIPRVKLP